MHHRGQGYVYLRALGIEPLHSTCGDDACSKPFDTEVKW
jgi:uncharacterized damage-inducible protein DinB